MPKKQPETKIVAAIIAALEKRDWLAWKVHTSQFGRPGISDILAVKNGRLASIEVKQPGKTPTLLQSRWLGDIEAHGGLAGVATSVDEALQIVGEQ
jgi:hypothetical protein